MSRPVQLLVTDLDNTLYDWVTFFATAFYEMVDVAVGLLSVEREKLLDELQVIHRRYRNSEEPFALLETESVRSVYPGLTRRELARELDPAFRVFNAVRKQTLRPYPGVIETLRAAHEAGCVVVGHTEATVPNAQHRLRVLQLTPFVDVLYAVNPAGLGHPDPTRPRSLPCVETVVALRQDERKPDPSVLLTICAAQRVEPEFCLYVGDSLVNDVGMAAAAGITCAWAQYGTMYDPSYWEGLVRITHWTPEDVRRAEESKKRFGGARPTFVLSEAMDELLELVTFCAPRGALATGALQGGSA